MLHDDPSMPRNSALPAEILWNGSSQLWLFEKIYCTKESLDNERACGEHLGWATGKIFTELASRGILEPIDWQKVDENTQSLLRQKHKQILNENDKEKTRLQIREWINNRNIQKLEEVKTDLIKPILYSKNSILGVSPNSLKNWPQKASLSFNKKEYATRRFIKALENPIKEKLGVRILNSPGTFLSETEKRKQAAVMQNVEKKYINSLMSGDDEFSGDEGYLNYVEKLIPHKNAYAPTDKIMINEWESRRDIILRIRDAAEKHLWPDLHSEWLPRLSREGVSYAIDFEKRIRSALRSRKLAKYLDQRSNWIWGIGSGLTVGSLLIAEMANIDLSKLEMGALAVVSNTIAKAGGEKLFQKYKKDIAPLALFYESALKD